LRSSADSIQLHRSIKILRTGVCFSYGNLKPSDDSSIGLLKQEHAGKLCGLTHSASGNNEGRNQNRFVVGDRLLGQAARTTGLSWIVDIQKGID
jgi:hypothetical protein